MKNLSALLLALISILSLSTFSIAAFDEGPLPLMEAEEGSYEVTVPAVLCPGESGSVSVAGIWPSHVAVHVTAPDTVTLTNSLDGGTKDLAVRFDGIALEGNDNSSISLSEPICVERISDALFGTWLGTIVYDITVIDLEDEIEAAVIEDPSPAALYLTGQEEPVPADHIICEERNESIPDPEPDEGISPTSERLEEPIVYHFKGEPTL